MRIKSCRGLGGIAFFLFILPYFVSAQVNLSPKDILEKNLQAAGGREKLLQIRSFSFKSGPSRYFVVPSGELKMMTGKEPVITEVTLVKSDKVERNSFNKITEIAGIQKSVQQTMAKLYAGFFTLIKFEKELGYQGLKAFGPEKLHHFTTQADSLKVSLFLSADDFCLKRLVFQGTNLEGDKYEINYDFAPFEEMEGSKIPLSWFVSQVGTRGNLIEISDIKFNQPLAPDFFLKLEVNIGTVEAAPGHLKGNILDSNSPPNGLLVVTNWTKADIDKAELKSGDELTFTGESTTAGVITGLVFYNTAKEIPPQNQLSKGAGILAPAPRGGETYVIQLFGLDKSVEPAWLKVLAPIEIRKK